MVVTLMGMESPETAPRADPWRLMTHTVRGCGPRWEGFVFSTQVISAAALNINAPEAAMHHRPNRNLIPLPLMQRSGL
jgi:hypothetical protein